MSGYPTSVSASTSWIEVVFADLMSGLSSLPVSRWGTWVSRPLPGETTDSYLGWARAALEEAERSPHPDAQRRHSVEAVGHAKRALDRLLDQYLQRDWLHRYLGPRPSFSERLALLKRRLGGSRVPWRLIPAVIAEPRNDAEHDYYTPTLEEAGCAVEAAEVVISAMRTKSDPVWGPAFLGVLTGGSSWTTGEPARYWFQGFGSRNEGFALWWSGVDDIVRVGCGRVIDNVTAEVIFCDLARISLPEHLRLLEWWDQHRFSFGESEAMLRARLELAHLDLPTAPAITLSTPASTEPAASKPTTN